MDLSQKIVWNLYSAGVAALSGFATRKAVDGAWSFVTGSEPPEPTDPDTPTPLAVARVVAIAVGMGLSQVLLNRFAVKRWKAFAGEAGPMRSVNLRL